MRITGRQTEGIEPDAAPEPLTQAPETEGSPGGERAQAVSGAEHGRQAVIAQLTGAAGNAPAGAVANAGPDVGDLVALKAYIAAFPRETEIRPGRSVAGWLQARLSMFTDRRLTNDETLAGLHALEELGPGQWLEALRLMATTPAPHGRSGESLLAYFGRKGLADQKQLLGAFIDQANRKLGLGLPTGQDRAAAAGINPDVVRNPVEAGRIFGKEIFDQAPNVLRAFGLPDHRRLIGPLNTGLEAAGRWLADTVFGNMTIEF